MSDAKNIPITDQTVVDKSRQRRLGLQKINLPEGEAICTDADSLTALVAQDARSGELFVMIVAVAEHEGLRLGSLSPMSADQARNFAASLYASADQVDGKVGVN